MKRKSVLASCLATFLCATAVGQGLRPPAGYYDPNAPGGYCLFGPADADGVCLGSHDS